MAWDKTVPDDSDLISDGPTQIKSNWSAIESGDSSLIVDSWNFKERASNPGAISSPSKAGRLFTKQDAGTSQTELFYIDDGGNVTQLTNGGKIGDPSVDLVVNSIEFDSHGFTINQNNIIWAYALVAANGSITNGVGLGAATIKTIGGFSNSYEIPFSGRNPDNTNYYVIVAPSSAPGGADRARLGNLIKSSKTTAKFGVNIQRTGSSDSVTDTSFQVFVLGGF